MTTATDSDEQASFAREAHRGDDVRGPVQRAISPGRLSMLAFQIPSRAVVLGVTWSDGGAPKGSQECLEHDCVDRHAVAVDQGTMRHCVLLVGVGEV